MIAMQYVYVTCILSQVMWDPESTFQIASAQSILKKTIELRKWQSFICASSCLLPYCTCTLKPPNAMYVFICSHLLVYCPACRTYLIATRFWVVTICPIIKCLTVLEFSFILFDLCLFITIFSFILNYVPVVTFWIFTYHKFLILFITFCFIWNYWIIYFLTCLEVFWSVAS